MHRRRLLRTWEHSFSPFVVRHQSNEVQSSRTCRTDPRNCWQLSSAARIFDRPIEISFTVRSSWIGSKKSKRCIENQIPWKSIWARDHQETLWSLGTSFELWSIAFFRNLSEIMQNKRRFYFSIRFSYLWRSLNKQIKALTFTVTYTCRPISLYTCGNYRGLWMNIQNHQTSCW